MTSGVPSVEQALEQVVAWKAAQLNENQAKIGEADAELEKLRKELENLKEQLVSLETVREQLLSVDLGDGLVRRSYDALFEALRKQSASIGERLVEATAANQAHHEQVFVELGKGELAHLAEEFRQFKEQVEPTLAALPESYRAAISQHHQGVSEKIRAYLSTRIDGPVPLDATPIELDLVFGIDAPEGSPEVLICVLPIPDVTFTEWASRPTDLATLIGARVAQAIYETTKRTGPVGAQAIRGGHQGLLAMEVDLEGASADFASVFMDMLGVVLKSAPELSAAKVTLTPRQVDFDFLLPPEDPDEES